MKLARSARRHPEIDVTNLIDVVLILLIYFAMSTKFTKDMQVELQRPSARSKPRLRHAMQRNAASPLKSDGLRPQAACVTPIVFRTRRCTE